MPAWTYGVFVWRELATDDVDAALGFYGELAGWKSKKVDMPNGPYHLLLSGETQVGGLMKLAAGVDMPPYWMSYLSVPDVDETLEQARRLGGQVVWGPVDVASVGRMGTIVDPYGAAFSVMKSVDGDTVRAETPEPGEFCWEQLATPDLAGAKAFYGAVLGWKAFPLPGSELEVFGFSQKPGEQAGSVVVGERAAWTTFIAVEALAPACERAIRLGGKVLSAKAVVPGIGTSSVIQDPQGAVVCLFKA